MRGRAAPRLLLACAADYACWFTRGGGSGAAAGPSPPHAAHAAPARAADDGDVPVGEAAKFAAAVASHELALIEGGDHAFSAPTAQYELLPRVTAFLLGRDG